MKDHNISQYRPCLLDIRRSLFTDEIESLFPVNPYVLDKSGVLSLEARLSREETRRIPSALGCWGSLTLEGAESDAAVDWVESVLAAVDFVFFFLGLSPAAYSEVSEIMSTYL